MQQLNLGVHRLATKTNNHNTTKPRQLVASLVAWPGPPQHNHRPHKLIAERFQMSSRSVRSSGSAWTWNPSDYENDYDPSASSSSAPALSPATTPQEGAPAPAAPAAPALAGPVPTPAVAEPRADSLTLLEWLRNIRLQEYVTVLNDLGASEVMDLVDINDINEFPILAQRMKPLEKKRFIRNVEQLRGN